MLYSCDRETLDVLLPHLAGLFVDRIDSADNLISLWGRVKEPEAACPECGARSSRVHGRYERRLVDRPISGLRTELRLTVRRFRCDEPGCPAKTFAEQVAGLTDPYARFTTQAHAIFTRIGLALAGRAGARLARALGVPAARIMLLRLVHSVPGMPLDSSPHFLGVDEFALRKGHVYGTVLIDINTRRPVDLLPDREAATFAAWLRAHPGTRVICRDRAGSFAQGGCDGAPDAIHVADRWHLWHNLAEAVERCVSAHRGCLREPEPLPPTLDSPPVPIPVSPPASVRRADRVLHRFHDRVHEYHATIHALLDQGHGLRQIARELNIGRGTVRRYARAATPQDLLHDQWQSRTSMLDPYKPHLHQRLAEGRISITALHREITALGFQGSYGTVRDYLSPRMPDAASTPMPAPAPTVRTVTG